MILLLSRDGAAETVWSGCGRFNQKLFIGIPPFSASSFSAWKKKNLTPCFYDWNYLLFWEVNLRYPHTPPHSSPSSCWVRGFYLYYYCRFPHTCCDCPSHGGSLSLIASHEDRSQVFKTYSYVIAISWGPDLCLTLKMNPWKNLAWSKHVRIFPPVKCCCE